MNKKNLIWFVMIMICLITFVLIMAGMIKKNSECINNPFVYAANTVDILQKEKDTSVNLLCTCQAGDAEFYFDTEGIYQNNPYLDYKASTYIFNVSDIDERGLSQWEN